MNYRSGKLILRTASCVVALVLFFSCFLAGSNTLYASQSWLSETKSTVYDGSADTITIEESSDSDGPGTLEGLIIPVVVGIGDWFANFFKSIGLTISSVVMGRVGGGGVNYDVNGATYRISLFTFELTPGNLYGIVASASYATIRGVAYIILACIVFARIVAASYKGGSADSLNALKESLLSFGVAILLMTLMPNIVDIMLYIRDVVLHTVYKSLGSDLLGLDVSELSFTDVFKEGANASLMASFMYLGSTFLGLWFAIQYIGIAMSYVVYFFSFPFVCLNMQFDKKSLGEWWKNLLGYILTPIADLLLLFIPLAFGKLGTSFPVQVIQLLVCTMLIPARSVLRQALGIRTNMAMEMAGLATLIAAGGMARNTVAGVSNVVGGAVGGVKAAHSDYKMGKMYGEMADNDKAVDDELTAMYNQDTGRGYGQRDAMHLPGVNERDGVDSYKTGASELEKRNGLIGGSLKEEGKTSDAVKYGGVSVDSNGVGSFGSSMGVDSGDVSGGRPVSYGEMLESRGDEIIEKYVNSSNFEDPAFRGLSNAKKAELYKARAKKQAVSTIGHTLGGASGLAIGGAVGLGTGTFFSPGAKMQLAGAGVMMGSLAGGAVGQATATGASAIGGAGLKLGEKAYWNSKGKSNLINSSIDYTDMTGGLPGATPVPPNDIDGPSSGVNFDTVSQASEMRADVLYGMANVHAPKMPEGIDTKSSSVASLPDKKEMLDNEMNTSQQYSEGMQANTGNRIFGNGSQQYSAGTDAEYGKMDRSAYSGYMNPNFDTVLNDINANEQEITSAENQYNESISSIQSFQNLVLEPPQYGPPSKAYEDPEFKSCLDAAFAYVDIVKYDSKYKDDPKFKNFNSLDYVRSECINFEESKFRDKILATTANNGLFNDPKVKKHVERIYNNHVTALNKKYEHIGKRQFERLDDNYKF